MNSKKIESKIQTILYIEESLLNEKRAKIKKINDEYDSITEKNYRFKNGLMRTIKKRLGKYFNKNNTCRCEYIYPDQIELRQDGVWVFFDAPHPNDSRDYKIPYNELI